MRGARELNHEVRRRKRDDLVRRLVAVEVVVIVLKEEDRRGAKVRLVDRCDLGVADAFENGFVVAAKNDVRPIELAGRCGGGTVGDCEGYLPVSGRVGLLTAADAVISLAKHAAALRE